ncbi:hypothetical protein GLOTRDRAFT_133944 [Gloeophyllum trabeum ATCC 11539]|uniref:Uncharacterized protein n=1 Tax=Gloeophyllum trabeum (strain ATCC 11539 / FP-39264 / Madison 617) TaxID=670483 RepID=S7PRA8_GLOTA|nr:uncharacterized protein GLOTRDRAFT_133944 [Gloeophyllum trabeum ATCC 11539]EPQ50391.1 hypothetical protein GLOTRDRAFT_133944 [Gloeophyllum trabeum ATCC 11539]
MSESGLAAPQSPVQSREIMSSKGKVEILKYIDPAASQCNADHIQWRSVRNQARNTAFHCALGIHRDPSRGHTHMIIIHLQWTPINKDPWFKFLVTECGVFKMADVLPEIEGALHLGKGEGCGYVCDFVGRQEAQWSSSSGMTMAPILILAIGEGVESVLMLSGIILETQRPDTYSAEWRKMVNKDPTDAPKPLTLLSGAKNAEHIF